jgi:hypothetical protein
MSNSLGLTNKAEQKFLTSTFKQNQAGVPGGTACPDYFGIIKYPTCSNTGSLAVIVSTSYKH